LKALSGVTPAVTRRRITGLIGPNGARNTTLVNVLTGFQRPDAGTAELEGEAVNGIAAHKLRRKGVARTFQSRGLFRELPVVDNLEVTGVGLGLTPARRDRRGRARDGHDVRLIGQWLMPWPRCGRSSISRFGKGHQIFEHRAQTVTAGG
jgi:ABC-type multidrug transport system ATPase subunit